MKRGSIELARRLCVEIAGPADEDDDTGRDYGSVDVAEILSAEVERLLAVIDTAPHNVLCKARQTDWRFPCDCFKRLARLRGQD